ncbi:GPW/gp25 family protein [Leisingera sp. M527]|uniref:GPW/gp25 family protein n=1 Tax=Leisingera sp. M527 TaxID=2867014 RepID=UPI0021A25EFE|nr:GPW/gp25 family protein [Leisingera sp. M527]
MPWMTQRAAENHSWRPLETGEWVRVVAPSGDLPEAVLPGAIPTRSIPRHGAPGTFRLSFEVDAHQARSILDILPTSKSTLAMLRDYGSHLPAVIDQPLNGGTLVDAFQPAAEALPLWNPRISLGRVQVPDARPGYAELELIVSGAWRAPGFQLDGWKFQGRSSPAGWQGDLQRWLRGWPGGRLRVRRR